MDIKCVRFRIAYLVASSTTLTNIMWLLVSHLIGVMYMKDFNICANINIVTKDRTYKVANLCFWTSLLIFMAFGGGGWLIVNGLYDKKITHS